MFKLTLLFIVSTASLFGSGPVSHAYLTQRFFNYFPKYSLEEQKKFMVGTLFPDIRYLGEIKRDKTHPKHVTIKDILNEPSPFLAGMKYHAWVDDQRENYVKQHPISKRVRQLTDKHHSTYLKMIEDEYSFAEKDWSFCCEWLQEAMDEELKWGMGESTINRWHTLVRLSLANPPSTILFLLGSSNQNMLNVPAKTVREWQSNFAEVSKSQEMRYYVNGLNGNFESLLQQAQRSINTNIQK